MAKMIVDLPVKIQEFSSSLCKHLPEGSVAELFLLSVILKRHVFFPSSIRHFRVGSWSRLLFDGFFLSFPLQPHSYW